MIVFWNTPGPWQLQVFRLMTGPWHLIFFKYFTLQRGFSYQLWGDRSWWEEWSDEERLQHLGEGRGLQTDLSGTQWSKEGWTCNRSTSVCSTTSWMISKWLCGELNLWIIHIDIYEYIFSSIYEFHLPRKVKKELKCKINKNKTRGIL